MNKKRMASAVLLLSLSGCATSGQSTFLGTLVGTVVGGSIGALVDGGPKNRLRNQNIFVGSTLGALVGSGIGYSVHASNDLVAKNACESAPKDPLSPAKTALPSDPSQPILLSPKVETKYIDDQVRGNTFVPGHLEYQIVEPSKWSK